MGIKKEVIIGDCRKKERAIGHKKALKLYPVIGACVKCGNEKTERHHIDDNPMNNSPENIMALCRRCHTVEHKKSLPEEAIKKGCKIAAELRKAINNCPKGHLYDGENLYITPKGSRVCKECNRQAKRRYRQRGGRG